MENSMEIPQKIKIELPYSVLGIYLKECKSCYKKDISTPMFITALFIVVKLCKQPRCSTTDK
jgi:hypothetical protein